jgi:hypothetical protein
MFLDQSNRNWDVHLSNSMEQILFEKLVVTQLVNKFPAFYGTWRFITVLTTAHRLFLYSDTSSPHLPALFLQDPF